MSTQAIHPDDERITTSIADVEDAPRVTVQPSLNRDLAAAMTLLFVMVMYHIQHPTLLFEAQFGRAFRGASLQDGVVIGLAISSLFLIGSPRKLWEARKTDAYASLRLSFAVGILLFVAYALVAVLENFNIFYEIYGANAEALEDVFREDVLLIPVKVLGASALLGGAAAASILFLWSPWDGNWSPIRLGGGLLAVWGLVTTYHIQHPVLNSRSWIGEALESDGLQIVSVIVLLVGLIGLASILRERGVEPRLRHVRIAMLIVLGAYALHALLVVVADFNVLLEIFNVDAAAYDELLGDGSLNGPLLALDRAALFAGFAVASAFMLWAPWEKLALYQKVVVNNLTPIGVGILALALWEGIIEWQNIEEFLLPKPSVIWGELTDSYPRMLAAGWFTFLNAFKGFVLGCGFGILTGILSARFSRFSTAVLPLAIAANSIPIIAFAPITNFWFGVTSPTSKIAIVAVLCYFPAMISTVRGLTSVNPIQLELMRSYAASEVEIFRRLRIPNALPFIFSALKLATTLSMIGAIVAEFFGGTLSGLGYRIREDAALFRFPESWSAIIVASLFGLSFYLLISALGARIHALVSLIPQRELTR